MRSSCAIACFRASTPSSPRTTTKTCARSATTCTGSGTSSRGTRATPRSTACDGSGSSLPSTRIEVTPMEPKRRMFSDPGTLEGADPYRLLAHLHVSPSSSFRDVLDASYDVTTPAEHMACNDLRL